MVVAATHSDALKNLPHAGRLFATLLIGFMLGTLFGINSSKYGFLVRETAIQLGTSQPIQYGFMVRETAIQLGTSQPIQARNETFYKDTKFLPPDIVTPTTDLFLRRLWGNPNEDLPFQPKYLVTFTVGFHQKDMVNAAVSKFSKNWTIVLFHYDGRMNEWDQFEWSKQVIHISARKQSKWWFAKRFLHPDVVAPFEYIFIWDEDLDLEHFDAEAYVNLIRKHGLEISQPGLDPQSKMTWQWTKRLKNSEVHKMVKEKNNFCKDPLKPPCAGFVEIMAPVFSKSSWRCVWHMLQNDLVHGWGLDFFLGKCVEMPHERIGVVDAQYILHKGVPSLGDQGESVSGKPSWQGVRERCSFELRAFRERMWSAEKRQHAEQASVSQMKSPP